MRGITAVILTAAAALATPASAGTVFSAGASPEQSSPGSLTYTFNAGGGPGTLDFGIDGYASLDGNNAPYYKDTLTVLLNGTAIFSGSYDLGGGGANETYINTGNGTVASNSFGFFQGGLMTLTGSSINLLAGSNTLTFSYAGDFQGIGDEGWGVHNISVAAGVPEPDAWALMILGFGIVGAATRASRKSRAALRYI